VKLTDSQRRIIAILGTGWMLLLLVRQANHLLSASGLSLWLGGLLVTLPALRLNFRTGLTCSFVLGLAMDAWSPLGFGTQALLFTIAHGVIFRLRNRFVTTELTVGISVALITNLALYTSLSLLQLSQWGGTPISGLRLLTDLLLSQVVIAVTTPWFFALQERGLELVFRLPWFTSRVRHS
jgi:cell shape-determining protein MreD